MASHEGSRQFGPTPSAAPKEPNGPSSSKSGEASPSSRKPEAEEAEAAAGLDEPPPAHPAVVIGEAFRAWSSAWLTGVCPLYRRHAVSAEATVVHLFV